MTEDQFNQFLAVETAKLAALQGILAVGQSIAFKMGAGASGLNWRDVNQMLANAQGIVNKGSQPPSSSAASKP